MKVRWTRAAQRQLREILDFIAHDSPQAAAHLATRIQNLTGKIADQPLAGQVVPELGIQLIRERRVAPYRIFYSVASAVPRILAVHHQRRLLEAATATGLENAIRGQSERAYEILGRAGVDNPPFEGDEMP